MLSPDRHGITLRDRAFDAVCGAGRMGGRAIMLAKPQTFMNHSGEAVVPLVRRYLRGDARLIVVHDDIDLALGKLRLKEQGRRCRAPGHSLHYPVPAERPVLASAAGCREAAVQGGRH